MSLCAGLAEVRRGRKTAARTAADRPPGPYGAGQGWTEGPTASGNMKNSALRGMGGKAM